MVFLQQSIIQQIISLSNFPSSLHDLRYKIREKQYRNTRSPVPVNCTCGHETCKLSLLGNKAPFPRAPYHFRLIFSRRIVPASNVPSNHRIQKYSNLFLRPRLQTVGKLLGGDTESKLMFVEHSYRAQLFHGLTWLTILYVRINPKQPSHVARCLKGNMNMYG